MINEFSLLSVFLVGLLGSMHCVGMCGGIVGALTMSLPETMRRSRMDMLGYQLAYNSGRIASYSVAGVLAGAFGQLLLPPHGPEGYGIYSKWITAVFMIALGIYLMGWTPVLAWLERAGGHIWKRIEPLGRRLLPVKSKWQALLLGLLWGWLPCGLVYSALAFSLASGDALQGAAIMLAFGLGTLPMLLLMGTAARSLGNLVRSNAVRRVAGILIILFGLYSLLAPGAHQHHQQSDMVQQPEHAGHQH